MTELSNIPRRMRRFYRDQDTKLMKHLSKQVKKAGGIKEIEKQRIILSLKRQLETAKEEEVKDLATHLFEQASKGRDETRDLVFSEVMKRQRAGQELSNKEADAIATSIYAQLKEKKESEQRFEMLEKKQLKEMEKRERKLAKNGKKKERKERGRKKENSDFDSFDFNEPEEITKKDQSSEVEKIKQELSLGLGDDNPKKTMKKKAEKDDLFAELEEFNDEPEKSKSKKKKSKTDDEFSLEGFKTDL